jgi:(p)ppGpp synthase/HD superfamily hydrolase
MLSKAIVFATNAHAGQKDKNNQSYIFHPLRVMLNCSTKQEQIVAILHDVIEDTKYTLFDLRNKLELDGEISKALYAITRHENEPYFDYIDRVKTNELARKVKIKDLKDNLGRPGASESLRERYFKALDILGEAENV